MTKERLRVSDYRFLAVCLVLLSATVWFSARNFYRAFPEASIDFRVSRGDAGAIASRFLTARGYDLRSFREADSFTFDDDAKTFLEREAGLERANQLMSARVRLWHWSFRWFQPQRKEEYRADITPSGELAGFERQLPEDAARPAATAAEARALAEDFLRSTEHRDPSALDFVESSDVTRPNRVDRVFIWKERDFNLGDSSIRHEVTLLGNEVGGYRQYLKVPEPWARDYERLRSRNEVAQTVDTAALVLLVVGLLIVFVLRVRRQDVRWRRAAVVGVVGLVLGFLSNLNELPAREFAYPTTDSYGSFIARQLLQALLASLAAGGLLFALAAAAEPVYREAFPGKPSLAGMFRPRGLRTRRFFLGAVLGLTLTGCFIAYQTGFYIVAYRHGAWSPADVPYSDLLNTRLPWLFVLFGGYLPAVSEEFLFRMFAIPFLRKLTRSVAAALILAGFLWGFGHAGYPQQPFYIRGVEVGIGGVVLGLVMMRWGILPTLVWHYSVDAMYSAMLLVRSHNLYYRLSGVASAGIFLLPVLLALVFYWRRGGFEPETGLLNADEPAPPAQLPAPEAPRAAAGANDYRPLASRLRWAALAIFVLGLLALKIPVARIGESPDYRVPSGRVSAAADAWLRAQSLDPAAFRRVTVPATHWDSEDRAAAKYFLERQPVPSVSGLFERYRPVQHWVVRYFKSLDAEGVEVSVHPETGRVLGFVHTLPEDRPGADLPPEEARQIAAAFAAARGVDVAALDLKESGSEKKKARVDHTLVWEARPADPRSLAEARYRVEIAVSGDRVTGWRSYWKLPEAFERARSRQSWISIIAAGLRIGVLVAAICAGLWFLVRNIRKGLVRWRPAIGLALAAALLTAVAPLLSMDLTLQNYNSAVPLQTFEALLYLMMGMSVVFTFLMLGAASALLTSYFPESLAAFRRANRRAMGLDAGAALLVAAGLTLLSNRLAILLMDRFHARALFSIGTPNLVASAVPALAALAESARAVLLDAAVLSVIVLMLRWLPRRWMLVPAGLLAVFAMLPGDIRTPGEFALAYVTAAVPLACAAWFCLRFARANYLAYALVLWLFALRPRLAELFGNSNPALIAQGWIVAGIFGATLIWALLPVFARNSVTGYAIPNSAPPIR
jgi:membrane protease YdiL (CAAX protease family)